MHSNRPISLTLLLALSLSLTACLGTTPPSQFYLLEPIHESVSQGPAAETGKTVIALAPVRIPHYLDRPQIVTASGKNAYRLSELNRWAEALDENITRVLAQDLGVMVPAELVPLNASGRAKQAKFRVAVNILEFHVDPQGQAGLTAQWNIWRGEGMILGRQASYRVPASTTDYRAMVGALNECLNRLTRDLAEALRQHAEAG